MFASFSSRYFIYCVTLGVFGSLRGSALFNSSQSPPRAARTSKRLAFFGDRCFQNFSTTRADVAAGSEWDSLLAKIVKIGFALGGKGAPTV